MIRQALAILAAMLLLTRAVWGLAGLVNSVLPAGGLGDIVPGAIFYHSAGSCYTRAYAGNAVLIKDLATGTTTSTLGCSGGSVVLTAGSSVATTCASVCIVDTLYDQTTTHNCTSAACNLTQTAGPYVRFNNPFFSALAPNGGYGAHFQGYASGPSQAISSGSYVSGTGVITLTMAAVTAFAPGGALHTSSLLGTGAVASLNNANFVVIAPTSGTTVTLQGPTGLAATTITSGNTQAATQTLNNNVGAFSAPTEPYTVAWLSTTDGLQTAGTSGGPNACNNQTDCNPNVGYQTTTVGAITMNATSGSIATWGTAPTFGAWYSVLAVFNGASSQLCVNGTCVPESLVASTWGGLSIGNGTGGWGGNFAEQAMWSGDQHTFAAAIYVNQKARFGSF